jgi:hypothetical protein
MKRTSCPALQTCWLGGLQSRGNLGGETGEDQGADYPEINTGESNEITNSQAM